MAWEQVRRNSGAPGVDGESIEDFDKHSRERLWELSEALRTGAWQPKPLRRVWIPKPDGSKRGLAIPCVEDRVVHVALAMVLYEVFQDEFGPDCYAYVKGRSALQAVERVRREALTGKRWVVETDVAKFFDTVDRARLVGKLATRIADGSFLRLIGAVVRSGVLGEVKTEDYAGIPQGSPLSPLLANVYLAAFDREVGSKVTLVRYADDLVLLCATKEEAEDARVLAERVLRNEGLSVKLEKTRVVHLDEGVDFLGYRVTSTGLFPSARSVKRFQEKIRALTRRHDTRPLEEVVQRVMPVIRGWTHYFRLVAPDGLIWRLGWWILTRLRLCGVGHWWTGAFQRDLPKEVLYGMGLRLPYHLLIGRPP